MNGHMDALAIGRKCAKCERHREKRDHGYSNRLVSLWKRCAMRGCRGPELATRAFHRDLQNSFDNHCTLLVLLLSSASLNVINLV